MATLTLNDGRTVSAALGGRTLDGDQPVVVLVHGAGMDRTVWQMQTRFLAHHGYRVVAIDLPGHGGTAGPALETVEAYATWLADVLVALDAGPVHLGGHSMGAFIALELAGAHPSLVQSLLLFGVAAAMPVHPTLLEAAANNDPLAGQLMSGWALSPSSKTGAHPSPGQNMVAGTQAVVELSAPGVLATDLVASSSYEGAVAAAERVLTPTTLILGSDDKMTPVRGTPPLVEALTDATVVVLPECGHMMTVERPDLVRSALLKALSH